MMRATFSVLSFVSTVLLPWPCTVLLALGIALYEPLVPLAVGIFADTLYYTAQSGAPLFTLGGLFATLLAFFVRSRLKPGIIGG
jgi:hypothetical protein